MPLPEWPGTPTFVDGQIMSANAHLNRLSRAVRHLLGTYQTARPVFAGARKVGLTSSYATWWTGAIRHKANTLRIAWIQYGETIWIRIKYEDIVVAEFSKTAVGEQTFDESVDISGAGLVDGEFYRVTVEIKRDSGTCELCWFWLLDLAETESASLPTLPDCDDDDVLTAAQWNALSQYAEALYAAGSGAQPGFPLVRSKLTTVYYMVAGGIRHVSNSLAYRVWRKKSNPGYNFELKIVVNGTTLVSLDDSSTPTYTEDCDDAFPLDDLYYPYIDTLDLSGLGLSAGEPYQVHVWGDDEDSPYEHDRGLVDYLYEVPDMSLPSGWTALPEWTAGDYVRGSAGTPKVKDIRDDLAWLGARLALYNPACKRWYSPNDEFPLGFYLVHGARYLHYYSESEKTPRVRYFAGGEWQEVSLPADSSDDWRVYDLDQIGLLAAGRRYLVQGCEYVFEDVDP